jgi:hypothetical protein
MGDAIAYDGKRVVFTAHHSVPEREGGLDQDRLTG